MLLEPPEDPYPNIEPTDTTEHHPEDPGPAQDLHAERAVLGSVMLSPTVWDRVCGVLTTDDFYQPGHGLIWSALLALAVEGIPQDPVAVADRLTRDGTLLASGGAPYLHTLIHEVPVASNIGYWADLVAEKSVLRRLERAGQRIRQLAESGSRGAGVGEVIDFVRREIDEATENRTRGTLSVVEDLVWPWLDGLDAPPAGVVSTPWPELDDLLNGGVRCGELIVLAGGAGSGKTMLATNMLRTAVQDDIPAVMFSLEMDRGEILARLVADTATVPLTSLVSHRVAPADRDRVKRAAERVAGWPLWIDDSGDVSVADIRSRCRSLARHGLGLVVIDGLWLLRPADSRVSRQQQIADMTRPLKILAKELQVPVVLLHQLNREPSKRLGGKPSMTDLRDSGAPGQDADKVLLVWRREDRDTEVVVIVAKHRNGPTGEVPLDWHGRYARVSPGDPYSR